MRIERTVSLIVLVPALVVSSAALLPFRAAQAGITSGKIVFEGGDGLSGSFQIFSMNPDGTNKVQITNLPANNYDGLVPDLSPDGQRIAFCFGTLVPNNNPITDLYVINVDGTDLRQITRDGLSCFPRWSPDGRLILFGHQDPNGNHVITTLRADGTGTLLTLTSNLWDSIPGFFTPDASHIVYLSQDGGLVSVVVVMDAHGANKEHLTQPAFEGSAADVAPNGQHILVSDHQNSPPALTNDIFVMNPDGTGLTQLTHYPTIHHDASASYSPDGTKIVFTSDRLSPDVSTSNFGTFDIFTMNADGTNVTRIATAVASCPQDGNCAAVNWGPKP